MNIKPKLAFLLVFIAVLALLGGCSNKPAYPELPSSIPNKPMTTNAENYQYLIGPGDELNIFVWRNPEVSTTVIVRPDGKINTPLVEDIKVSDKTPSQVGEDIEKALRAYIKSPNVTVSVNEFEGPYKEQVRVIGAAAEPQSLPYNEDMTLLDLIIAVGGLTEFASGNKAVLARIENNQQMQYTIRIEDLIQDGDMTANVDILPGDIVIIPEAWF